MKNLIMKKAILIFIIFISIFSVACGHTHSYTTSTISPTNTQNGCIKHTCSCGDNYETDITCLITFESVCSNSLISNIPQVDPIIVKQNTIFQGVQNRENFTVISYTGLSIGEKVKNSTVVTIIWKEKTQAEIRLLEVTEKINKLYELSYNYNSNKALLYTAQFLRTAKYSDGMWNIMCGSLPSDFIEYITINQGNFNVVALREIETLTSPKTNENIDFIHLFAVINSIINTNDINSNASDIAGWVGDLSTLVQEVVISGVSGNNIKEIANQKFNSESSSFSNLDLLADIDAVNIMNIYYNSTNQTFADVIKNYYLNTTVNMRKNMFLNNIFGKTYTSASIMTNDILERIENNTLTLYFFKSLNINLTTHSEQFLACATAFSNYFVN